MIPDADIVALSGSVSNHWSRKSEALIVISWTKTACWRSGSVWKRAEPGRRAAAAGADRAGQVGRGDGQDRLDEAGHLDHELAVFLVRLGVDRRPAPELADRPAVVVDAPQVVAGPARCPAGLRCGGPSPSRSGRERAVERQDVEAVPGQLELADDLRPQQRHDVREDREPEAREDLLGDGRAAEDWPPLEDERPQPGPREVGGADEAVVAAADHDGVVALGHGACLRGSSGLRGR